MNPVLHAATDLLATALGSAAGWGLYRRYLRPAGLSAQAQKDIAYWLCLVAAALIGAYSLGTINLILSDQAALGRSVFGALIGGIIGIELYKRRRGLTRSTGAVFVLPLALGLAIGRIGCFLAGLADFTYGTETDLPWGWDFGDGIRRHPVQLYESLAMLGFALWFLIWAKAKPLRAAATGFYIFVAYAAILRFFLEFLKPYGRVFEIATIFQIGALALLGYAFVMLRRERGGDARA